MLFSIISRWLKHLHKKWRKWRENNSQQFIAATYYAKKMCFSWSLNGDSIFLKWNKLDFDGIVTKKSHSYKIDFSDRNTWYSTCPIFHLVRRLSVIQLGCRPGRVELKEGKIEDNPMLTQDGCCCVFETWFI